MPDFTALLQTPTTALIIVLVALAGCLRGFSGFGSAMVLAPVLGALLPLTEAVPLIMLLEVGLSFQLLPAALRQVDRREVGLLTVAAVPGIAVGTWALETLDPSGLRLATSAVILAFLGLVLLKVRRTGPRTGPGLATTGLLSGIANGAAGIGGPPIVLYYLAGDGSSAVLRATVICYFFLIDAISIGVFAARGLIDGTSLGLAAIALPAAMLGVWVGSRMFERASEETYRAAAYAIIAVAAILSPLL